MKIASVITLGALWLVAVVTTPVGLMACGRLLSSKPAKQAAKPVGCPPCRSRSCDAITAEAIVERDACQAKLETKEPAKVHVQRRTVEVPVEVEGPPRKCGGEAPKIVGVPSAECAPGMLCLDTKGQLALAANLALYEKWVARVVACERGAAAP